MALGRGPAALTDTGLWPRFLYQSLAFGVDALDEIPGFSPCRLGGFSGKMARL